MVGVDAAEKPTARTAVCPMSRPTSFRPTGCSLIGRGRACGMRLLPLHRLAGAAGLSRDRVGVSTGSRRERTACRHSGRPLQITQPPTRTVNSPGPAQEWRPLVPTTIAPLLQELVAAGGSDLHLRAGRRPLDPHRRTLHKLATLALDEATILALLLETMPERPARQVRGGPRRRLRHRADPGDPVPGQRLPLPWPARGGPPPCAPASPMRLADLGLPAVVADACAAPAWPDPRDGPGRLRKDDDARGHGR